MQLTLTYVASKGPTRLASRPEIVAADCSGWDSTSKLEVVSSAVSQDWVRPIRRRAVRYGDNARTPLDRMPLIRHSPPTATFEILVLKCKESGENGFRHSVTLYEVAFQDRLVGGNVPRPASFPGTKSLFPPTVQVPRAAVSAKVESQYFTISRSGACWEHVMQTRNIGVYVPGELPSPEMELVVLLES